MNPDENPKKKPKKRVWLIILCVLLAFILAAIAFATAYVYHLLGLVTEGDNSDLYETLSSEDIAIIASDPDYNPNNSLPTLDPSDLHPSSQSSEPVESVKREGIINIMLVGEDRKSGQRRQRSDSMILCSFNTNNNTITMISFLRDTYIPKIPGYWADKLNAAYAYGGINCMDETLATYFGVHVDANIVVQFDGFINVIDLLGGVDIELTQKESDHMNKESPWHLHVGMNHLTGEQALAYSRIRKIDMDAMRAQRQRKVLTALINAYKNKPVNEMLSLTTQILQSGFIQTDMTANEVLTYVTKLFPMLATATINNQQIPADGTYNSANVGNVTSTKVCDFEANRKILREIFQ